MRKHSMPEARRDFPEMPIEWDIAPQAFDRWTPNLRAASTDSSESTISILDEIGTNPWTGEGTNAKRIAAALRAIGPEKDVIVHLNSPGGNMFEGMAIYNLLREHKGDVTVKVLGIAASVASIVAMAGDVIQMPRSGFLMIHNCWGGCVGNRHDMQSMADMLEPFDIGLAEIYAARTGLDLKSVMKKMDAETFINGSAAVDEGWADSLLPADQVTQAKGSDVKASAYVMDSVLAKGGMTRSQRRSLMQDFKTSMLSAAGAVNGKPSATENSDTPSAVDAAEYLKLLQSPNILTEIQS